MSSFAEASVPSKGCSAYPWILEHILTYPGTYEIPLRTMYTLNSTPSSQRQPPYSPRCETPSLSSSASSLDGSPQSADFPLEGQSPITTQPLVTDHFKQCLMDHISQLPTQPFSLPPSFITTFVRRCFTEDLCMVDFTQALTALDYLKDLELRRRRELSLALQRIGLNRDVVNQDTQYLNRHPRMAEWVASMQEKDRKVEALYTQVYLGLRRWTLINEMRLEPFSKANSIAMLNTLYPPSSASAPTRQLTAAILSSQRNAFFRYITAVEQNGRAILKSLEQSGARPGDINGWTIVRDVVDKYLRTTNSMVDECMDISSADVMSAAPSMSSRADSGIGFAPSDRPDTSTSNYSKVSSGTSSINKPLPASPRAPSLSSTMPPPPPLTLVNKKRGTTIERIARELRNFRNRNDVKELPMTRCSTSASLENASDETPSQTPTSGQRRPDLRKMKSMAAIGQHGFARSNTTPPNLPHSRAGSDDTSAELAMRAQRRLDATPLDSRQT